jgi:hypothetical protein
MAGKGDLVAMRRQELSWLHYIPSVQLSCLERSARICARILYNAWRAENVSDGYRSRCAALHNVT